MWKAQMIKLNVTTKFANVISNKAPDLSVYVHVKQTIDEADDE